MHSNMEKPSNASEPYVPDIGSVVRMALKLNQWASMAAHSYGLYSGINAAISGAHDKGAPIVAHADQLRTDTALLCIVRLFATIDRNSQISLRSVDRFLKLPSSPHELAAAYAAGNDRAQIEAAMKTCKEGIDRFQKYYSTIEWNAIRRMQGFRNAAIAHITW